MFAAQVFRYRARHIVLPVLGGLLVVYFGYHAVHGERGLLAYLRLTQEFRKAEITRDLFHAERQLIERRTALLRPEGIDPDMLDERVRTMLNVGRRDELVIMLQRQEGVLPVITKP